MNAFCVRGQEGKRHDLKKPAHVDNLLRVPEGRQTPQVAFQRRNMILHSP